MRVCWNRQTGTFEGRVSLTYEFKSRHSHQREGIQQNAFSFFTLQKHHDQHKGGEHCAAAGIRTPNLPGNHRAGF